MTHSFYCDSGHAAGWALGVQGAHDRRACVGRVGVARRALRRHGRHGRAAAGGASVRGRADGRERADGRQRRAGRTGRAQQGRQARGLGAGRWARGLGAWASQDCALGAPDLIFKPVFDSVFSLSQ